MSESRSIRVNPVLADRIAESRRFMLLLSYDGTPFCGWQVQPGVRTVQENIETALRTALRVPLHIVGAGRTDTGVNARYMTAHFDVPVDIANRIDGMEGKTRLLKTLNALLRPSIAIFDVVPVDNDCHARFDATSRTYRYYLHTAPDPFRAGRSRELFARPDFDAMNREAASLLGTQDFTSFSKLHTDTNNNICTVTEASWHEYSENHYFFEISANRFLRNMVRAVVGTLLDVGTGKYSEGHVRDVIKTMDRCSAGTSVPGYALYLWDIKYPYELPKVSIPDHL